MLRVRWLGRVRYDDAHALQRALFGGSRDDHLLLLEHPHVFTLGVRADPAHVLVDPARLGAELARVDRGGDVTYHGPGQLVGYPILSVPGKRGGGMADTVAYVRQVEQLLIDVVRSLGLEDVGRVPDHPGVWVAPGSAHPRKLAAIGIRLDRGRSMHGFALNVHPDLGWFERIVPCGIADKQVTSLRAEGIDVELRRVVDEVASRAMATWAPDGCWERQDVAWTRDDADLSPFSLGAGPGSSTGRKPPWMRRTLVLDDGYRDMKRLLRGLDLVTVCEEAGCPNISECWNEGTATFMVNGDRCTRSCGFCLVDTRRPSAPDLDEPERVAEAVERLGLDFAVITAVARDDLPDGGAGSIARCIEAVRRTNPSTRVEVLVPDCKGDPDALGAIFEARPDVLNHNIETVPRLQRRVRPSASYARSLAVLARARAAGLHTKSGLMVGLGETEPEVEAALADLVGIGVGSVTIGQYLQPTSNHLAVERWWLPEELDRFADVARALGIPHVESSPFTRSSYHAGRAFLTTA